MKKIAFIFPGQGSQSLGMGKDFFEQSDIAKDMISSATAKLGIDFEKLLFEENDLLEQTEFTQPAILLVSSIATKILQEKCNITPVFTLGHSLGEISALVSVGALDYLDGIELVHNRGLFMKNACEGKNAAMMALLGLSDDVVEKICEEKRAEGKLIWAANYNIDGQLVLAGARNDLESCVDVFKSAGAKRAIVLNMSVASHCPMLEGAVEKLGEMASLLLKDNFIAPVISNATCKKYNSKSEAIELLKAQLTKPVLYKQSILAFEDEIDLFIELGNGSVLKGLNKKSSKPTLSINNMASLNEAIEAING
jgi:[acyl-carrier-protein] S-malonyltransferase